MAKAKSKSKFDFKQFLLKKGEYLAMGIAGLLLFVLTLWGITKWSSAKDPDKISKDFAQKSQQVTTKVASTDVTPEDKEQAAPPAWVTAEYRFNRAPVSAFPLTNPQFDPTAKPDTKKENPNVYPIGAYQVDLTRGSMKGFDLVPGKDGELMIGVIIDKRIDPQDKDKIRELTRPHTGKKAYKPKTPAGGGMGTPLGGGMGQPPGRGGLFGGGFPPMGGGMGQPPGMGGSMGSKFGGGNPYGGMGGRFDSGAQRVEKALDYVPIGQLDEAIKHQKIPAMTVIPLRMITIHAEIPLKKQIEEIKRALRLPNSDEAARWGPYYDGYDVRRKISSISPDGTGGRGTG